MSYIDKFIEGLQFLAKVDKGARKEMEEPSRCRGTIEALQTPEMRELYVKPVDTLTLFAERYADNYPGNLAHSCHSVSHGFLKSWENSDLGGALPLAVTIGNVHYKGQNIYNVSKSALKRILNVGHNTNEKLNVHVWLTLDNMTVFDLTILASLAAMEIIPPLQEEESPVLVWREDSPGEFNYEPLLIDNTFFDLVDPGSEVGLLPSVHRR